MKAKILKLKPTQFAVGMDEVDHRIKEMNEMSDSDLHNYLRSHKIPVIRGPEGLYLIDKHHLIRACWEMGLEEVHVVVKADLRKKRNFWQEMFKNNWVYLVDQFGNNHHWTEQLPRSIKCMADNPWRSLAWRVRIQGGFEKSTEPFAEFQWAEYFRRCHKYLNVNDVDTALQLCQSPLAKRLPGYKHGK